MFEGDIHDNTINFILKIYLLSANQHYDWTSLLRLECVIEKTQEEMYPFPPPHITTIVQFNYISIAFNHLKCTSGLLH